MRSFKYIVLGFFFLALAQMTANAEEKCSDLLLHFVDEPSVTKSQSGGFGNRNVTAIIPCENGDFSSSGSTPTTLHFVEHSEGRLCVSSRSCGNVKSWWGYFGVTAGWSDLTLLRDFWVLSKSSRLKTDWNGYQLVGTFAISGGQIERDCSPLSPPTCVDTTGVIKK